MRGRLIHVLDCQLNVTLLGEFQGISNQIKKNLTQSTWITVQRVWNLRVKWNGEMQTLILGGFGKEVNDLMQNIR